MNFKVTEEQHAKINKWLKEEVYPEVIEQQKESRRYDDNIFAQQDWESGHPYRGAIGGGLTYEFTPTSIGLAFVVRESFTGKELNLTDYDLW